MNLGTELLEITSENLSEAQFMASNYINASTQNRVFFNVIGSEAVISYLSKLGLNTDGISSIHSIKRIVEKIDIADIILDNIHIDVRVVFNENEIFIPKSHYTRGIVPDIYAVLKYDKSFQRIYFIGFFEPSELDLSNSNSEYYFFDPEKLHSAFDMYDFISNFNGKTDANLSEAQILRGRELSVSVADHDVTDEEFNEFIRLLSKSKLLRNSVLEYDNFETLASRVAMSLKVSKSKNRSDNEVVDFEDFVNLQESLEQISEDNELETADTNNQVQDLNGDDLLDDMVDGVSNIITDTVEVAAAAGAGAGLIGEQAVSQEAINLAAISGDIVNVEADELINDNVEDISDISQDEVETIGEEELSGNAEVLTDAIDTDNYIEQETEDKESDAFEDDLQDLSQTDLLDADLILDENINLDDALDFSDIDLTTDLGEEETEQPEHEVSLSEVETEQPEGEVIEQEVVEAQVDEDVSTQGEADINDIAENQVAVEEVNDTISGGEDDFNMDFDSDDNLNVEEDFKPEDLDEMSLSEFDADFDAEEQNEQDMNTVQEESFEQDIENFDEISDTADYEDFIISEEPVEDIEQDLADFDSEDINVTTDEQPVFETSDIAESVVEENSQVQDEESEISETSWDGEFEVPSVSDIDNGDDDLVFSQDKADVSEIEDIESPELTETPNIDNSNNLFNFEDIRADKFKQPVKEDYELVNFSDLTASQSEEQYNSEVNLEDVENFVSFDSNVAKDENSEVDYFVDDNETDSLNAVKENSVVISDKNHVAGEIFIDINNDSSRVDFSGTNEHLEELYNSNNNIISDDNVLSAPAGMSSDKGKLIPAVLGFGGIALVLIVAGIIMLSVSKFINPSNNDPEPLAAGNSFGNNNNLGEDVPNMNINNNQVVMNNSQATGSVPQQNMNQGASQDTAASQSKPIPPTSFLSVRKLSWEVPDYVSVDSSFRQYFQSAGKSLKAALTSDLLLASDYTYSDQIRLSILYGQDGTFSDARVLLSSGSAQVDNIVLQSVNQTLRILKAPNSVGNDQSTTVILKIYL